MSEPVEYRDVRPDGNVLLQWFEVPPMPGASADPYGPYDELMVPAPPWERQSRDADGNWVTIGRMSGAGSGAIAHWEMTTTLPDGTKVLHQLFWE